MHGLIGAVYGFRAVANFRAENLVKATRWTGVRCIII